MPTLTPKKILIVDDDQYIVETVRTVLESSGYNVAVACDGQRGLELAEAESPDLIILDMMMPHRSGLLILETLRLSCPLPVRVIMITANDGERHQQYAESLGVDAYFRKPFPIDDLMEKIRSLLGPGTTGVAADANV